MPSEFQSNEPPHVLGIPVDVTPPRLWNSSRRNPPSPSEFRDAARGMGMDIFWNHPMTVLFSVKLVDVVTPYHFHICVSG